MTAPDDILESVAVAIDSSGNLPDSTTYVKREVDMDGAQAGLRMPIVELVTANTIRNNEFNTDLVGYATDDFGNRIGYIFHARFEMDVRITVYTAEVGDYEPDRLGEGIRRALLQYDSNQMGSRNFNNSLPDGNGGELEEVVHFTVGSGSNEDDLNTTPALRRWQQQINLRFYDEINTVEEYGEEDFIRSVSIDTNVDGEPEEDGNVQLEYVPVDDDEDGETDSWEIQIAD